MTAPRLPAAYAAEAWRDGDWSWNGANRFLEVSPQGVALWQTTTLQTLRAVCEAVGVEVPSRLAFTGELLARAKDSARSAGYRSASSMRTDSIDRETWRGLLWLAWRDGMADGGASMGTDMAGVWLPESLRTPELGTVIPGAIGTRRADRVRLAPSTTAPPRNTSTTTGSTPRNTGTGTGTTTGNTSTTTGATPRPPLVTPQTASMGVALPLMVLVGGAVVALAWSNRADVRRISAREALGFSKTSKKGAQRSKARR